MSNKEANVTLQKMKSHIATQEELDHINMAIKALEENDWIPVSERLPEEETDVLICNINGDVKIARGSYSTEIADEFIWYTSGWRFGKVIAWMPLPEAYKEKEE